MKRKMLIFVVIALAAVTSMAALDWGYTANLEDFDVSMTTGWLVQMYQDVNTDSSLNSISAFNSSGVATGTGVSDDVLLGSFTASLSQDKDGNVIWGVQFANWSDLYNDDVYSVIYNASDIVSASQAVVIDSTPNTLAGADPEEYKLGSVANNWVAVPEPATAMLLALGGGLAWLIRLKQRLL